jgi:hypothetical protein
MTPPKYSPGTRRIRLLVSIVMCLSGLLLSAGAWLRGEWLFVIGGASGVVAGICFFVDAWKTGGNGR